MVILCHNLLPYNRVHASPADIGETMKPITVFDGFVEVDVARIISIVSDFNIVFRIL